MSTKVVLVFIGSALVGSLLGYSYIAYKAAQASAA
jgi:hypothetical protein